MKKRNDKFRARGKSLKNPPAKKKERIRGKKILPSPKGRAEKHQRTRRRKYVKKRMQKERDLFSKGPPLRKKWPHADARRGGKKRGQKRD